MKYYNDLLRIGRSSLDDSQLGVQLRALMQDFMWSHDKDLQSVLPRLPRLTDSKSETHIQIRVGREDWGSLSCDESLNILTRSIGFQWSNGQFLIPVLIQLVQLGLLEREGSFSLLETLKRRGGHERCLGVYWGALNLLGLQGFVNLSEAGVVAQAELTPTGRVAHDLVLEYPGLMRQILNLMNWTKDLHAHLRNKRTGPELELYQRLIGEAKKSWDILRTSDEPLNQRVLGQIKVFLDGVLLAPALVAVDMARFEKDGSEIKNLGPSVRDCLVRQSSLEDFNRDILDAITELFCSKGIWVEPTDRAFSRIGDAFFRSAPYVAGLSVSYLPSYVNLKELLLENPDLLDIQSDGHINRIINIYGSSGAGSGPAIEVISEEILMDLFDKKPLNEQPRGIADMGCGDGRALTRMAEFIVKKTKRGESLKEYPLFVVGADLNKDALSIAADNLATLHSVEGVITATIQADVSRPDAYNESLLSRKLMIHDHKLGTERPLELSDLVHTFMFIVHNRILENVEEPVARIHLANALKQADHSRLLHRIKEIFHEDLAAEDLTVERIERFFRTGFTSKAGFVPGFVVAADLIQFLRTWKPYAAQGFVVLEAHSPWCEKLQEKIPDDSALWMRVEKLPHLTNWGMHFVSRQYLLPFNEYLFALELAGLTFKDGRVHGKIHQKGFPNIDYLDDYRFFSIGCMTSSTH